MSAARTKEQWANAREMARVMVCSGAGVDGARMTGHESAYAAVLQVSELVLLIGVQGDDSKVVRSCEHLNVAHRNLWWRG